MIKKNYRRFQQHFLFIVLAVVLTVPTAAFAENESASSATMAQSTASCIDIEALAAEWVAAFQADFDIDELTDFIGTDYHGTWNGNTFNGRQEYTDFLQIDFGNYQGISFEVRDDMFEESYYTLGFLGTLPPSEDQSPDVEHLVALDIDIHAMCEAEGVLNLEISFDEDDKQCQEESPFRVRWGANFRFGAECTSLYNN